MKRHVLLMALALLMAGGSCFADSLPEGTFLLNDGTKQMTLNIRAMPDGKYIVDGMGTTAQGKTCRVGDLAEFRGGKLILGTCQMDLSVFGNQLQLMDSGGCAHCEAGASMSGAYQKQ